MSQHRDFQKQLDLIAGLVRRIEDAADPSIRADARKLVESLMNLHGGGLERALEIISTAGDTGQSIIDRLGRDEMVSSLLVLYGIHPLDFETRLNQGVEKARTFLKSHSADLELLQNDGGRVRLRLTTHGQGCGSNPSVLKEAVEELIYESAPDVTALIVEGAESQSFVPIAALNASLAKGVA